MLRSLPRPALAALLAIATAWLASWASPDTAQTPEQAPTRVVLAELFTGSECPPCEAADLAFDRILETYSRAQVAVLEYHVDIPAPDPMSTGETWARALYYMVDYRSAPRSYFDGHIEEREGGVRGPAVARYLGRAQRAIDEELEVPPALTIEVRPALGFSSARIEVMLEPLEPIDADDLALHLVIYQDKIEYTGRNRISTHRCVVRKMVDGPEGHPVSLADGEQVLVKEVARGLLTGEGMGVVAFVQERDSRRVHQARVVSLGDDVPDAVALHDRGVELGRAGRLPEAMGLFQQAVAIDPDDPVGRNSLGLAYAGLGRLTDAAREWERVLEIDPGRDDVCLRLSYLYEQRGMIPEAIQHLERYLSLQPSGANVERERARLRRLKGGGSGLELP